MEKTVVQSFLYPAFLCPPPTMNFSDQFAFRPTGSTTAAIINLLHIIANMLLSNPYVIVISLDFSKAFDMVRHSALLDKLNQLDNQTLYTTGWLMFSVTAHSAPYSVDRRHRRSPLRQA